jgi:hypothetical protein
MPCYVFLSLRSSRLCEKPDFFRALNPSRPKKNISRKFAKIWRIFHALSGPDPMMWGEEQKGK